MKRKPSFEHFRKVVLSVLSQSGNCEESQAAIRACATIPELVQVWKKYWSGVIEEVPTQFIAALEEIYPIYAEQINSAGVWYNEIAPQGMCVIGNVPASFDAPFVADSQFNPIRVYVLGRAKVIARGITQVYCNCADAEIELHDSAKGTVSHGFARAFDRSTLVTADRYEQHDKAQIFDKVNI